MSQAYYALTDERACLTLAGDDVRSFLQGLISNDVERVSRAQAIYAALLNAQGRFLHDMFLVEGPKAADGQSAILLDGEAARLDDLKKRLTLYKLRAKVAITDSRDALAVAVAWGEGALAALGLPRELGRAGAFAGGVVYGDPRLAALGGRAMLPREGAAAALEKAGLSAAPLADYHRLRISLGVPDGSRDLPPERALLLENGFEELHGVDFKKGCYIGQEITARMKHRALIKKRLLSVAVEGPLPAAGAGITLGSQDAGEMRSGMDAMGLALLRLDLVAEAARAGQRFTAGDSRLSPREPALAQKP